MLQHLDALVSSEASKSTDEANATPSDATPAGDDGAASETVATAAEESSEKSVAAD